MLSGCRDTHPDSPYVIGESGCVCGGRANPCSDEVSPSPGGRFGTMGQHHPPLGVSTTDESDRVRSQREVAEFEQERQALANEREVQPW